MEKVTLTKVEAEAIMTKYHDGKKKVSMSFDMIRPILSSSYNLKNINGFREASKTDPETASAAEAIYKKGTALIKEAKEEMVEGLSSYVYYIINTKFHTYRRYMPDLYQEGVIGILKGMESYDPELGMPATYFNIYIVHEIIEFITINVHNMTPYQARQIASLKKAIKGFEKENIKWNYLSLSKQTGLSEKLVKSYLSIMDNGEEVHYDAVNYSSANITEEEPSPEEQYIEKEKAIILNRLIEEKLTPSEGEVLSMKYGLNGKRVHEYKEISYLLHMDDAEVKKLRLSAINKIKRYYPAISM